MSLRFTAYSTLGEIVLIISRPPPVSKAMPIRPPWLFPMCLDVSLYNFDNSSSAVLSHSNAMPVRQGKELFVRSCDGLEGDGQPCQLTKASQSL